MDVAALDKPRRRGPLEGGAGLDIEGHRDVVGAIISGLRVIRIAERALDGRTNPTRSPHAKRHEILDPRLVVGIVGPMQEGGIDLGPVSVFLDVGGAADV